MDLNDLVFRTDRPAGDANNLTPLEIDTNFRLLRAAILALQQSGIGNPTATVSPNNTSSPAVGVAKEFIALANAATGNTIAKVELLLMANATTLTTFTVLDTDQTSPYVLTWTPTAAGNFPIRVRATDDKGNIGFSAALQVQVQAASTKLAKPIINTPVRVTSTTADFSWPLVPGADGYVFRLNGGAPFSVGNVSDFLATQLPTNTDVTGEVYATDSTGARLDSDYAVLVTATTLATGVKPKSYLVLFGGQSNVQTLARRSDLWTGPFKNVKPSLTRQFQKARVKIPGVSRLDKLQVGSVNYSETGVGIAGNEQGQQLPERPGAPYEDGFSYMIPLAQQFELQNPNSNDEICFVQVAMGATALPRFMKDDPNTGGALYNKLKSEYNATIAQLTAEGREVVVLGYMFKQGEADALSDPDYGHNLVTYGAQVREIIGSTPKIGIDEIMNNGLISFYDTTIKDRQDLFLNSDPHSGRITTKNSSRLFDQLHIDGKSVMRLGMEDNYNFLFNTNVKAPVPAELLGGYYALGYWKAYLPGATQSYWPNYAGRIDDAFQFYQADPSKQFQLVPGRAGKLCYRSNGTSSLFFCSASERTQDTTHTFAIDLDASNPNNTNNFQGLLTSNNVWLSVGSPFQNGYDGRGFFGGPAFQGALGQLCVVTFGMGTATNSAYMRLNGQEVWRGTVNPDSIGALYLGARDQQDYMKGDIYAYLLWNGLLSPADVLVHETQLASELGIAF